ncbi:hypothetical protein [Bacillus sp. REN16]|uniref:hypothetical protein n=1 Tax=Bacillus sp. REN16 TaxID=2887296 RepID=UPI001E39D840|nr:hypothetical protein [Bacillus sp. REN16]MCC3356046.1 hypothetical protein [Bacillus sp. REN16]
MNFKRIFWGYIFILIEIHLFVIDLLPDPIGYYFIYSGISAVSPENRIGNKLKKLLIVLMIISIPTLFIQQNDLGSSAGISLWDHYSFLFEWLRLVLVYFVFRLIMEFVTTIEDKFIASRSSRIFKVYMTVMLIITFTHTFAMNLSNNIIVGYLFLTIPLGFIMEIMFLVLVWKLDKYKGSGGFPPLYNNNANYFPNDFYSDQE